MIDPDTFRAVLGRFASGVTVVTTIDSSGADHGMTVSAFCSVSLEPPLILICIDRQASALHALDETEYFAVSILSAEQESISRRFAASDDRFGGLGYQRGITGAALLDDALAYLECRRVARHEAGDHIIFIGEVEAASAQRGHPLIFFRGGYGQLDRSG
jgi:flavin reductase (DIM6/NTAB) family NADH-FMN oxidoreductase RutF